MQEIADAYGGYEHREAGRGAQRLVRQALDYHAQHRADHHGQQHAHPPGQAQRAHGQQRDIAAHHDHVAVGEVQHLGDAVDHGVAQGYYGVDAAQAHAAYKIGQKFQKRPTSFILL